MTIQLFSHRFVLSSIKPVCTQSLQVTLLFALQVKPALSRKIRYLWSETTKQKSNYYFFAVTLAAGEELGILDRLYIQGLEIPVRVLEQIIPRMKLEPSIKLPLCVWS